MFNNRDDEYGGPIENRLRFPIEMIREMKKQAGEDFPVLFRINGDDLKGELANTSEDICKYIVPALEKAGLDCFDVSHGGNLYAPYGNLPCGYYPRAAWMHLPAAIKQATSKPVIGVGRVLSVEMAEKVIREGKCDIMYFGRQAYTDPEILHKFIAGHNSSKDVRQCIGCDTNCFPCTINPEAISMVSDFPFPPGNPVETPKNILVVGGGVGGMEFARHAARRGHRVTLWEKESRLGGTIGILATTPHLSEFQNIVDYLSGQMAETDVDVRVCYEATIERIKAFNPDAVVLATGASEKMPEHLESQPMVMGLLEAMVRKREFRSFYDWHKKVWFSGFIGAEFALDLCEEGAEVTMMAPGGDKAVGAEPWVMAHRKAYLRRKLTDANFIRRSEHAARANIKMLFKTKFESVDAEGIHYYHNGIHKVDSYDVVIVQTPRNKNNEMFEELQTFCPEVHKIGDCNKIGKAGNAIFAGNRLAKQI
jgi:pyruvate/2-oxoglutarate dehydrogenase complex dihydrolipoamide dehydrogenase (E3) component